ncbi:gliding motility-associated C-terminal domain-containing protein [Flavobacterium lipolyticum]|uniref:Gliding motility-associated C-terminal domain-containing protein n=1 Tax=Flavobacterium lipolyticum TaxID=2893754 RepID=A0ABS8M362_9FLAO|nr:gliding motility-associated C-terminal domain-containing protein [Flavobacterium sp. F-126]MCC9019114.1 gliding motility-associated C-terminal domain-containing protein [Flavobacterium sp. F-126]
MVKKYTSFLQFALFFIVLLACVSKSQAQCAGTDEQHIICDIEDPVNQSISLFSLLGGTPTPGGIWTDNNNLRGLDPATGMLNAQLISSGGTYQYTYTVTTPGCVVNKAIVTLTIGAYSGIGTEATICNDRGEYNLFTAFNSVIMGPHSNGTWRDSSGRIVKSTFTVPKVQVKTTYNFTYTVPPVLACESTPLTSAVKITVVRKPEAGDPTDKELCGTTDLGPYANFDLHELLSGEDMGGMWSGPGITASTGHTVDLQALFATSGAGEYSYTYTVFAVPNQNICENDSETVKITLEKRLDFTGARVLVDSDICEDKIATASYIARIMQGPQVIPNGEYEVQYTITGPTVASATVKANFTNGVLVFPLSSNYFKQIGTFTLTVTSIIATSGKKLCTNIIGILSDDLIISPFPRLDGAVLTTTPVCQNQAAIVQLSNASLLANGTYRITYNLMGDNVVTGRTVNITVSAGSANFVIPASLNVKSGSSAITITSITNITNPTPQCSNVANVKGNQIINPLPDGTTIVVQVENFCFGEPVPVAVSGLGNLTDVTLSYTLSGDNSSVLQTVVLAVANGKASFVIPQGLLLNTGSSVIIARNLKNNTTSCDVNLSNVVDSFVINTIPNAPIATSPQVFCKVEGAVITNLTPRGAQYKWYSSGTATTPLADTYVLKTEQLYVREISTANCISAPTPVSVVVNDTPAPTLNSGGENFCGLKNPTIADLSKATNVSSTVAWYDAENNGNLLTSTTLLRDKATYYGFDLSIVTSCISDDYLGVTVSLFDCNPEEYAFFIPDGFSPNGDNVNDTFRIPDIEFLYPDYTLEIFNRYGNVMFKGNRNKPNWDGRNSESAGFGDGIVPNGVYFYVVNFNKDNRRPQQGRLYLNR